MYYDQTNDLILNIQMTINSLIPSQLIFTMISQGFVVYSFYWSQNLYYECITHNK